MRLTQHTDYALRIGPIAHVVGHWSVLQPIAAPIAGMLGLVILLPGSIYDRVTIRRIRPVSLWGAVFVFGFTLVFFVGVASTTAWRNFAVWLVR